MLPKKRVELISIGDELLNGSRANSHLVFIGGRLMRHGLPILRAAEVRDEPVEMEAQIRLALNRSDLIFITGGLGPTPDDLTVATVAGALGRPCHHDKTVEQDIREFFKRRNRTPTDNNFRQCQIVEGARVLRNANGTAPGQWIEHNGQVIVLLPGPPNELHPMFEAQVLPLLQQLDWLDPSICQIHLRTIGIGESQVAKVLTPLLQPFSDRVRVAYCAHLSYVDVFLTASAVQFTDVELFHLGERCRSLLGAGFLGYGELDIAALILRELREGNQTLSVAESCTGGLLSSRFTDVPGASKTFKGGLVCYRNEIKENLLGIPASLLDQHGAVSAECSVAMATGVADLMESDYALSITGFAGPEGGSEPAGTIYVGYCSPIGVWSRKIFLPGNRIAVKERATAHALDFMRLKLDNYRIETLLHELRC